MRPLILPTALWLSFFVFSFHAITASLDSMTQTDCQSGVQRACEVE